jgi:hypothetical protein
MQAPAILYHTTDSADAILDGGFLDGEGSYGLTTLTLRAVFLSDQPVDCNEGAKGDQVLQVTLPADVALDASSWSRISRLGGSGACLPA